MLASVFFLPTLLLRKQGRVAHATAIFFIVRIFLIIFGFTP